MDNKRDNGGDGTENEGANLAALAQAYGLERLRAIDPDAFARALTTAAGFGARTERPTEITVEPAHTCRFRARGPRR